MFSSKKKKKQFKKAASEGKEVASVNNDSLYYLDKLHQMKVLVQFRTTEFRKKPAAFIAPVCYYSD